MLFGTEFHQLKKGLCQVQPDDSNTGYKFNLTVEVSRDFNFFFTYIHVHRCVLALYYTQFFLEFCGRIPDILLGWDGNPRHLQF